MNHPHRMSLLRAFALIVLCSLFSLAPAAHAQLAVYGTGSFADFGHDRNRDGTDFVTYGDYGGFGGGAYYNFNRRGVKIGVDVHDVYTPDYHGGNTGSVGVRFGFVSDHYPCHPYLEFGPAWIHINVPGSVYAEPSDKLSGAAFQITGGLDIRAARHLDIRVVELQDTEGSTSNNVYSTHLSSFSVGAGIVVHIPHTR